MHVWLILSLVRKFFLLKDKDEKIGQESFRRGILGEEGFGGQGGHI